MEKDGALPADEPLTGKPGSMFNDLARIHFRYKDYRERHAALLAITVASRTSKVSDDEFQRALQRLGDGLSLLLETLAAVFPGKS